MLDTRVQLTPATTLKNPKLYLNGFPKSGLHLANRMALGMFQQNNPKHNWLGTNAWTTEKHELDTLGMELTKLQHGEFVKGHMGHLPSIECLFILLGIGVVFVYRDLRDVVVSHLHHILSDEIGHDGKTDKMSHPNKKIYRGLGSNENIMLAIIEGIGEFGGLFERFETYAPWFDSEWAMTISFEVMKNNSYLAACKFFDYSQDLLLKANETEGHMEMNATIRKVAITGIMLEMAHNPAGSTTFRKGLTGEWKKEFTPVVVDCFKEHDPGWLVKLSYEQDDTWQ